MLTLSQNSSRTLSHPLSRNLCAATALVFLAGIAAAQPVEEKPGAPAAIAVVAPGGESAQPPATSDTFATARADLESMCDPNKAGASEAISAWMDKLLAGQAPKEIQLELLEAAGKQTAPNVKEKLERLKQARMEEGGLSFQRQLLYGGSAERGRKIFFEKPQASCIKCHQVGLEGAQIGPPLTKVATNLTREIILESILYPSAKFAPGYETAIIKLKDRSSYRGMVKRDTETELTLACTDEDNPAIHEVTVQKADVTERWRGPSLMPDGFDVTLSSRELRDLVEFLANLK